MGRRRSVGAGVSRSAAAGRLPPKRASCSTELGALDDDGRITDEGRALRALPLPPRLARMVVDAARDGAGEMAAQIAVLVGERGLGGNDVDLTHRLDQFRRDRSRRADEARGMAQRWARLGVTRARRRAERTPASAPCSRSPIPTASRRIAAADRARSCSRTDAAPCSIPHSALAREPFIVAAELTGTAAQARILLAAPITLAEIEARFADRIAQRRRDQRRSRDAQSARRARRRKLGAIALSEQIAPVEPSPKPPPAGSMRSRPPDSNRLPWSANT